MMYLVSFDVGLIDDLFQWFCVQRFYGLFRIVITSIVAIKFISNDDFAVGTTAMKVMQIIINRSKKNMSGRTCCVSLWIESSALKQELLGMGVSLKVGIFLFEKRMLNCK